MIARLLLLTAMTAALAGPTAAQTADQTNPAPPETGQAQLSAPGSTAAPAVSGVTVTPKSGKVDPKLQCQDDACLKSVVQELKTRYPQVYRGLMQWCMLNDTGRMAFEVSDVKAMAFSSGVGGDNIAKFEASPVQKTVCNDRFAKAEPKPDPKSK